MYAARLHVRESSSIYDFLFLLEAGKKKKVLFKRGRRSGPVLRGRNQKKQPLMGPTGRPCLAPGPDGPAHPRLRPPGGRAA